VQVGELARIYGTQMDEPENRAAMWQWLIRRFDAYRARLPAFAQSRLPRMFSAGSCSEEDAERVSGFLAPRIEHLAGGERGLGQTLEGIRQCGALRGHVDRARLAEWAATHARSMR
jgi:cytosol alanyl aminopeptidase